MGESLRIIDLLYNGRKAAAFRSKNYELTKEYASLLNKPRYSIKAVKSSVQGLTYRKANDWENKDLISGNRTGEGAGWRKFSIVDVVKLNIITDLKKVGLSSEYIRAIVNGIADETVVLTEAKTGITRTMRFLALEHFILSCLAGERLLLVVNTDKDGYVFNESDVVENLFLFEDSRLPVLLLPFFTYIQNIVAAIRPDLDSYSDSPLRRLFDNALNDKEKELLSILSNKDYSEVLVKKTNGDEYTVRAKSRRSGKFTDADILKAVHEHDYQTVTVIKQSGQSVQIIQDEGMKI